MFPIPDPSCDGRLIHSQDVVGLNPVGLNLAGLGTFSPGAPLGFWVTYSQEL